MREIRPSGSEGGARSIPCPYPYRSRPLLTSATREQATRPSFFLNQHPQEFRLCELPTLRRFPPPAGTRLNRGRAGTPYKRSGPGPPGATRAG